MMTGKRASLRVFSHSSCRSLVAAITITVALFSLMPLATCASNRGRFEGVVVSAIPFMGPPRYFLNVSQSGLIRLLAPQEIPIASMVGWRVVVEGSMETQGKRVIQASSIRPVSPTAASATKRLPSIMMLASFSDLAPSKTRTELNNMAVQGQGYYSEVSYGKARVTGKVVTDWEQMPNNECYYGEDDDDSWELVRDAVNAFDGEVNFGKHNYVVVTHAGNGEEASGVQCDIWSVRWQGLLIWTNDFIIVTHGAIVPETEPSPKSPLGAWVHEYGHELGLPDLYLRSGGDLVGPWDLMAGGSWNGDGATPAHPSAYCKIFEGWIASTQITIVNAGSKSTVTIGALESSSGKLVVKLPLADGKYYLIEYRRKIGYDAALPDEGIVITLVDPSKASGQGIVTVIDRNPGTSTLDDAAFRTGESYNNPSATIAVSVISTSASSAVILVDRTQQNPT